MLLSLPRQLVNRFGDPVKTTKSVTTRLTWWGPNHVWEWLDQPNGAGSLVSWEKLRPALRKSLGAQGMLCPGSPDGKCWFAVPSPDGQVVLKAVDLDEGLLKEGATGSGLVLKQDGIQKR